MEYYEQLAAFIQGDIYEALMLSGVKEVQLSYFLRKPRDGYMLSAWKNFFLLIKPDAKNLIKCWKKYTPDGWLTLPQSHPNKRELTKLKTKVRTLWRMKPLW